MSVILWVVGIFGFLWLIDKLMASPCPRCKSVWKTSLTTRYSPGHWRSCDRCRIYYSNDSGTVIGSF